MSRVQMTETEAILAIDEILDKQFNSCLAATYNELVCILNENAAAGRTKIKGSLILGFNPMNSNYEDIRFAIAQKEILELCAATERGGRAKISQIGKFTYRYNLFGWDSNVRSAFAFQFFGGIFGLLNKTGKLFVVRLNEMLSGTGLKFSIKKGNLVTNLIVSYECDIPSWYMAKELIEIDDDVFEQADDSMPQTATAGNCNNQTSYNTSEVCNQSRDDGDAVYSVILKDIGPNKIAVIKVVRE